MRVITEMFFVPVLFAGFSFEYSSLDIRPGNQNSKDYHKNNLFGGKK
jgi:hypothetical protein